MIRPGVYAIACVGILAVVLRAGAQDAPAPQSFTLAQAIQYAGDHYPTVQAALERITASQAGVAVARSAYLPRLDGVWQSTRATVNNISGELFPQSVIPALTGPVFPATSGRGVWGSAAGALVSWEPFDFGLRHAGVSTAEAAVTGARATEALTKLQVQAAVASAFLDVLAADRAVQAAQADVGRRDVLARAVHALADNQLRPGAEASRADAEHAAARTRLIQAQQSRTIALTVLTRLLGVTTGTVDVDLSTLLDQLPASTPSAPAAAGHPLAQARQAAVQQAGAERELLSRSNLPRVFLQSSVFARGSGASANGTLDGALDGLGFDRTNWGAGVQVLFPNAFDFSTLRARKAAAEASQRAAAAEYAEALLTVTGEQQAATATLAAARAIAANTPVQLAAAQQSESQARARYQAGLASVTEVAEAQNLLAQADTADQLARVDIWRALLDTAAASGDLSSFLSLLSSIGVH